MSDFEAIAARKGWSVETQVTVLLDYIENQQSDDAFLDFLEEQGEDNVSQQPGEMPVLELHGLYTSKWEEGDVTTSAAICTQTGGIVWVGTSDVGDEYEHLISESIQVKIGDEYLNFECEDGDLSDEAARQFLRAYREYLHRSYGGVERNKIEFRLEDTANDELPRVAGAITIDESTGLYLQFDGYTDCNSDDNMGTPVFIENHEGELRLIVHGDVNHEDPTHTLSLEGARNTRRREKK